MPGFHQLVDVLHHIGDLAAHDLQAQAPGVGLRPAVAVAVFARRDDALQVDRLERVVFHLGDGSCARLLLRGARVAGQQVADGLARAHRLRLWGFERLRGLLPNGGRNRNRWRWGLDGRTRRTLATPRPDAIQNRPRLLDPRRQVQIRQAGCHHMLAHALVLRMRGARATVFDQRVLTLVHHERDGIRGGSRPAHKRLHVRETRFARHALHLHEPGAVQVLPLRVRRGKRSLVAKLIRYAAAKRHGGLLVAGYSLNLP